MSGRWWMALALGAALPAVAPRQAPRMIALDVTVLPREFSDFGEARARFDSLSAGRLRAAGFALVPAESSGAVWRHYVDSVGGFFDTYTGKRMPAKFDAVRQSTLHTLKARFHADAWLHPMIQIRTATFDGSQV